MLYVNAQHLVTSRDFEYGAKSRDPNRKPGLRLGLGRREGVDTLTNLVSLSRKLVHYLQGPTSIELLESSVERLFGNV